MIKLFFLILAFSAPYVLGQSFGLFTTTNQSLELLKLETQVKVEGESYAKIHYSFIYKNPSAAPVQIKFVFPPTRNAIFHKFEATFQNQTFTTKVVKRSYDHNWRTIPDGLSFPTIQPNETVYIEFIMIQPLGVIVSKFYELKLPAFINGDIADLSPEHWNIKIQLESRDEFVVLSNPTHRLVPEIWSSEEGDLFRASWNATVAPNKEFAVYFGPEDLKNYTLRLTDPQDPNANMRLYHLVPNKEFMSARDVQNLLENTSGGPVKIKKLAVQSDMPKEMMTCAFVIDRSESMKGSPLQLLKKALKVLLIDVAPYCKDFHIVSFGSTFEHHSGFDDVQEAIKWVDTIEADMGGSDLAKALRYTYELLRSQPGRITIILTDGDVSESIKAEHGYFVVGIGEASKGFIKSVNFSGVGTEFVTDHKDLGDQEVLNILLKHFYQTSPECAITFGTNEGDADQARLFYKSNRYWYSFLSEEASSMDLFYYTSNTNLKTCDSLPLFDECHGGLYYLFPEDNEDDSEAESLFEVHDKNVTDIWRTVVDVVKLQKVEDIRACCEYCDEDVELDLRKRSLDLSLGRQLLSRWSTSLVLQTKSSFPQNVAYSAEFFDLSKFNERVGGGYEPQIIEIPKDYVPLDSIARNVESIDL